MTWEYPAVKGDGVPSVSPRRTLLSATWRPTRPAGPGDGGRIWEDPPSTPCCHPAQR